MMATGACCCACGTWFKVYDGGCNGIETRRAECERLEMEEEEELAGAVVEVRGVGRRWEASLEGSCLRHMLPHCNLGSFSYSPVGFGQW